MTYNYFLECTNPDEVKKQYRMLAMHYHPDRQNLRPEGERLTQEEATEIMKAINAEYNAILASMDGLKFKGENDRDRYYKYSEETESMIIDIFTDLFTIKIPGNSEYWIIGSWIWITKTTKDEEHAALREKLKAHRFRWNATREAWQWSPPNSKSYFRASGDFDDIAATYGAKRVTGKKPQEEREENKQYKGITQN